MRRDMDKISSFTRLRGIAGINKSAQLHLAPEQFPH
jgi:hypothetical protein